MVFDPATLTGKVLWLRAKDNLGINGSAITTWADQSSRAHDGIGGGTTLPTVATASTPLGGKSVAFSNSGYFALPALASSMVMTASLSYGGYPPALAANGNTSDFWLSNTNIGWLQARPVSLLTATSYTISPPLDLASRAPRDWTFQGSNDGATWTILDTQTAITFAATSQTFSFANSVAYTFYRLNVTANNGQSNMGVAELQINGISNAWSTSAEMWIVITTILTRSGSWLMGSGTALGSGDEAYYVYTDSNIYENFGLTSGNRQAMAPSLSVTSWRIYRVSNDGATWKALLDGISQLTASSKPVGWSLNPLIGNDGAGFFFNGNIAEVLIRDRVSTTQEVTDITAYLQAEHFVAATIPPRLTRPTMMSRVATQQASRW